ncbi:PREDICTED: uncharacterized protein LOC108771186 [Cyphomyrmex costatus]|uniref:DUF7041 domain-containing protein n=1 Tax=Cyphomyrmex costatus TaxID=456900 RepID=A0A151K1Q2_9HYME|nr:PREDICTED: uncharacterized protein LOC108771186 [Cyphomyrmex costatus]KYN50060.1 hypothetical protein ALC62_00088 [Cyphomyrmex costatus]
MPAEAVADTSADFAQRDVRDPQGEVNVTRIVKLPPFWKDNPFLWFTQVEAVFALSRITADETKFRYVIVNLDQNILPFVSDILASPPAENKYGALKTRIISSFDESNESKLRRLLRGHELGDEKPSHFLQRLRNLAAGQCNEAVMRTLFLEQMPESVRSILAISELTDLSKLAQQADRVVDVTRNTVAVVSTGEAKACDKTPQDDVNLHELKKMVESLSREVKRSIRRSRSKSRGRGRSKSKEREDDICYYHSRFGEQAKNCRPPCTFKKQKAKLELTEN